MNQEPMLQKITLFDMVFRAAGGPIDTAQLFDAFDFRGDIRGVPEQIAFLSKGEDMRFTGKIYEKQGNTTVIDVIEKFRQTPILDNPCVAKVLINKKIIPGVEDVKLYYLRSELVPQRAIFTPRNGGEQVINDATDRADFGIPPIVTARRAGSTSVYPEPLLGNQELPSSPFDAPDITSMVQRNFIVAGTERPFNVKNLFTAFGFRGTIMYASPSTAHALQGKGIGTSIDFYASVDRETVVISSVVPAAFEERERINAVQVEEFPAQNYLACVRLGFHNVGMNPPVSPDYVQGIRNMYSSLSKEESLPLADAMRQTVANLQSMKAKEKQTPQQNNTKEETMQTKNKEINTSVAMIFARMGTEIGKVLLAKMDAAFQVKPHFSEKHLRKILADNVGTIVGTKQILSMMAAARAEDDYPEYDESIPVEICPGCLLDKLMGDVEEKHVMATAIFESKVKMAIDKSFDGAPTKGRQYVITVTSEGRLDYKELIKNGAINLKLEAMNFVPGIYRITTAVIKAGGKKVEMVLSISDMQAPALTSCMFAIEAKEFEKAHNAIVKAISEAVKAKEEKESKVSETLFGGKGSFALEMLSHLMGNSRFSNAGDDLMKSLKKAIDARNEKKASVTTARSDEPDHKKVLESIDGNPNHEVADVIYTNVVSFINFDSVFGDSVKHRRIDIDVVKTGAINYGDLLETVATSHKVQPDDLIISADFMKTPVAVGKYAVFTTIVPTASGAKNEIIVTLAKVDDNGSTDKIVYAEPEEALIHIRENLLDSSKVDLTSVESRLKGNIFTSDLSRMDVLIEETIEQRKTVVAKLDEGNSILSDIDGKLEHMKDMREMMKVMASNFNFIKGSKVGKAGAEINVAKVEVPTTTEDGVAVPVAEEKVLDWKRTSTGHPYFEHTGGRFFEEGSSTFLPTDQKEMFEKVVFSIGAVSDTSEHPAGKYALFLASNVLPYGLPVGAIIVSSFMPLPAEAE